MGTFAIDILTGKQYLFNSDFSGGTFYISGSTYPQVNLYSNLPAAAPNTGKINIVRSGSGSYIANRNESGLYFSNGTTWNLLDNPVPYFSSTNFQVYDSADNTKGISFITSGITSGSDILLTVQNQNGTIAYLSDVNLKLNITTFATYSGTTVPANYYNKLQINSYSAKTNNSIIHFTGSTLPANYYNKLQINSYTAETTNLINTKLNFYSALQLTDISGGTNVNNIIPVPIVWTTLMFTGNSLTFTGGSKIYFNATGSYEIDYVINLVNTSNSTKNVGSVIRKNGNTEISQTTITSTTVDLINNASTNGMPVYLASLTNGDYIELIAYRIGNTGVLNTVPNSSWIKIKRIT